MRVSAIETLLINLSKNQAAWRPGFSLLKKGVNMNAFDQSPFVALDAEVVRGKATHTKPPLPVLPLRDLQALTIPQAYTLCKELGWQIARKRIDEAIRAGLLRAYRDDYRIDRLGQPRIYILRKDLDAWLSNRLQPLKIKQPGR